MLAGLQAAAESESVTVEVIAPKIGGATASDGSLVSADQKLDGAPSVLYDAVVIAASEQGAADLTGSPAARDFVSDAYAHGKFIGYTAPTMALFSACGLRRPSSMTASSNSERTGQRPRISWPAAASSASGPGCRPEPRRP